MPQIFLYIVLSLLVALLGIGKRGGFLLHFVLALILTPVGGVIVVLLSPDAQDVREIKSKSDRT
jgi:Na+/melibiose symporter-like transporter